jgi:hypothetical protein
MKLEKRDRRFQYQIQWKAIHSAFGLVKLVIILGIDTHAAG